MENQISAGRFDKARYLLRDNVNSLKIRVRVRRAPVRATNFTPAALPTELNNKALTTSAYGLEHAPFEHERVFGWQEKVFSTDEQKLYSKLENCRSKLEKRYFAQLNARRDSSPSQTSELVSLYTYTNEDCNERSSSSSSKILSGWPPAHGASASVSEHHQHPTPDSVLTNKPTVAQRARFRNTKSPTLMLIMGDFSCAAEVSLCCIADYGDDCLVVWPAFSSVPYKLHLPDGRVFEYTVESIVGAYPGEEMEVTFMQQLAHRHQNSLGFVVGKFFSMPAAYELHMFVFGEIVCARDFHYDDLFVKFWFELPSSSSSCCWRDVEPTKTACGAMTTPVCRRAGGVHQFSCSFEKHFVYNLNDDDDMLLCWPRLMLEVGSWESVDSWQRYRLEGVGVCVLPTHAGASIDARVKMCRPVGTVIGDEMRRFFVGSGTPNNIIGDQNTEMHKASRYQHVTTTTGSVDLRFNVLFQDQQFISTLQEKRHGRRAPLTTGVAGAAVPSRNYTLESNISVRHDDENRAVKNVQELSGIVKALQLARHRLLQLQADILGSD